MLLWHNMLFQHNWSLWVSLRAVSSGLTWNMCETAWDKQQMSAFSILDSVRSMLPQRSAMQRGNSVFTRATADSSPKRTRQEENNN